MAAAASAPADPTAVPLALAAIHRSSAPGAVTRLPMGPATGWERQRLEDVVVGAGFSVVAVDGETRADGVDHLVVTARRERTLADTVGPGMRLLLCGLNPSVYSADAGLGFARPGNRFWPAALAAGLVTVDRDPVHALVHHGVGMTDLVKRATPRADALTTDEYRDGVERVRRLVEWLTPGAVVMVGLAGWRAAVDRRATAGVQPEPFGGRPVYVMPSTSGLNAHTSLDGLTAHLRAAAAA